MSGEQDGARQAPAPGQVPVFPVLTAWPSLMPVPDGVFSFRYARTDISLGDDGPAIRHREARYADGRLLAEEWEGVLAMQAYQRMVAEAQGLYLRQLETVFRLLTGGFFSDRR